MKTATIESLISWRPCWLKEPGGDARLRALPLPMPFTALDVLRLADVSAVDRLWAVLRPEMLDDHTLRLFACDCAERALMRERAVGREPHADSWAAVAVARRHADGQATDEELRLAGRAAAYAYDAAAWAADAAYAAGASYVAYAYSADSAHARAYAAYAHAYADADARSAHSAYAARAAAAGAAGAGASGAAHSAYTGSGREEQCQWLISALSGADL